MSLRALRVAAGATMALSIGLIAPLVAPTTATAATGGASLGISAVNARDIGGYDGQFGSKVRTGLVFRANALNNLNVADQAKLVSLGIKDIVDFRAPSEVAASPDVIPAGITYTKRPIWDTSNDFYAMVNGWIGGGPTVQQAQMGNGKAAQIMRDYYQWIIKTPDQRAQLAATFKQIATSPNGLLYHCTSGKDRTGIMSAILLTALGTPKNEVYSDYLLSNDRLKASNDATLAQLQAAHLVTDPSLWWPILGVQADYLDATFAQINQSFGSFDNFVRTGLGVDATTLAALKKKMLTTPGNGGGAFGSSVGNGIGFGS